MGQWAWSKDTLLLLCPQDPKELFLEVIPWTASETRLPGCRCGRTWGRGQSSILVWAPFKGVGPSKASPFLAGALWGTQGDERFGGSGREK